MSDMANPAAGTVKEKKRVSQARRNLETFLANKLAVAGGLVVILFVAMVIMAPLLTPYDPALPDLKSISQPPSPEHIFGTDKIGRDVFARVLYGGRTSIMIGVVSSFMGSLIGIVLGCIGGYFGGKIDAFIVRMSEIFMTFPQMILILILTTFVGKSVFNIIFIFSFTGWMTPSRLIRGKFLTLREETYVSVCRAFGISKFSIMFKHILPNAISPIIVAFSINVAGYILSEAGLSYLGLGVAASVPTWGNILNAAKSVDVILNEWWLWVFPGVVLSLFVLSVNFLGDGLRDVYDPKG
ncbi:MAG TPA: ABC transporter permease [Candidatus Alectryocaccomicrobium excrementavium]|uniref:ABC transporter permease n=1 Tax=Candidatus Alectryocaccomicrobium excrementavium TaxID=2840668 RepID=A0A9D1G1K3_9FIRM|nr:ABC transporter permease [Candidatus Alectryocaccomicrobium excrementavium]